MKLNKEARTIKIYRLILDINVYFKKIRKPKKEI